MLQRFTLGRARRVSRWADPLAHVPSCRQLALPFDGSFIPFHIFDAECINHSWRAGRDSSSVPSRPRERSFVAFFARKGSSLDRRIEREAL